MSRRHTSGFSILGMDRDPTPGDPDQIDQLARFYEEIRDDAQTGVRVLGRGGSLSRARGESMEKLRDMLDSLPRKLQQAVDSFDTAAQAYRIYSRALREQQTRIDTAMDQATEAVQVVRLAVPRVAVDATPGQEAAARSAANEIDGARDQLSAAQRLAADARRLREAASARCNRALDDAASKAIKPPPRRNFFQRIGDFFRNNPILRLIIDVAIAVVGVLLPVVGIVLAAVALVVTVAVQAANGNFELGTLVVGLVALVPGAKLFGPFVRGAKAVAPGLVKTAGSGAAAFGQFGRNNTVISGLLRFGGRGGGFGNQVVTDFGKGVVEEAATIGLNKLGKANDADFNAASIFGGAAAGAAAGGLADGFRKGFTGDPDFDLPPGGGTEGLSGANTARGGDGAPAGDIPSGDRASATEPDSAGGGPPGASTSIDPPASSPAPSSASGGDGSAGNVSAPTAAAPPQPAPAPVTSGAPAAGGGTGGADPATAAPAPTRPPGSDQPAAVTEPAAKPAAEPAAKPAAEPAAEPAAKPAAEPAAEPVGARPVQPDAPPNGEDAPDARKVDEEPAGEKSVEERAGEAVTGIVSSGASDAASAAIENEEAEDPPTDAVVEAAVQAGFVLGAADAATGASTSEHDTGITRKFRR
ncbi:hypothetical protein [Verrucosispora sp. WMMD1129]|uniref:hypothetical protein n=1 Tax=Verrucosispora sp. WMMD1129 TaxID=3016093 RepID=UPI00249AF7C2|nr:hypothetical protein [Verrucosispora sp. WMMD1129]WFE43576.1 hypothetical protein O7624_04140 [Verrucosispora sp. WMMD1129]